MEVTARWEHLAARLQELLSVKEGLEHPLVEQHVAHRLGDDDVHLLGQLDLIYLAADHLDHLVHLVGCHQLVGVHGDTASLHCVNLHIPTYIIHHLA